MCFYTALILLACGVSLCGQTSGDPEILRAKEEIERLRKLVDAGAAPALQLRKAEEAVVDAEDAATLRKTLYGSDLSEAQTDEMVAAAERRLERRQSAYDAARKVVDAGAAAPISLNPLQEQIDFARKEYALAQSRAALTEEIAMFAELEETLSARLAHAPGEAAAMAERFDGDGVFTMRQFGEAKAAFEAHFGEKLPVSAMGETAVHRSLGFDHRGRVDVAVQPDSLEGRWLREYLEQNRIPFFAFRQAVRGKATGAHIHIGPMSTRLATGG